MRFPGGFVHTGSLHATRHTVNRQPPFPYSSGHCWLVSPRSPHSSHTNWLFVQKVRCISRRNLKNGRQFGNTCWGRMAAHHARGDTPTPTMRTERAGSPVRGTGRSRFLPRTLFETWSVDLPEDRAGALARRSARHRAGNAHVRNARWVLGRLRPRDDATGRSATSGRDGGHVGRAAEACTGRRGTHRGPPALKPAVRALAMKGRAGRPGRRRSDR